MICFLCKRGKDRKRVIVQRTFGNTTVDICIDCAGGVRATEAVADKLLRQAREQDGGDRS